MPRSVFVSFHYDRDIMRVQQVKQHYITKGTYTETGFCDGSLEERAKKDGDGYDNFGKWVEAGAKQAGR